jgi:rRNA small subunit pseudouridine methyltransferase Nep1
VETLSPDVPLVIALGAMSHGDDTFADNWVDQKISVSQYSLSASVACARLCGAFENMWDII